MTLPRTCPVCSAPFVAPDATKTCGKACGRAHALASRAARPAPPEAVERRARDRERYAAKRALSPGTARERSTIAVDTGAPVPWPAGAIATAYVRLVDRGGDVRCVLVNAGRARLVAAPPHGARVIRCRSSTWELVLDALRRATANTPARQCLRAGCKRPALLHWPYCSRDHGRPHVSSATRGAPRRRTRPVVPPLTP